MSFVISDSEGEESHQAPPPPKFRPRVVNRPTPVRARQASNGASNASGTTRAADKSVALHLSDSDDDSGSDDTSFFRIARPSLGPASVIDAGSLSNSGSGGGSGSEREAPNASASAPPLP
ncbi:hypothetical protein IWW39_006428, partial [Coemansia spiralis]